MVRTHANLSPALTTPKALLLPPPLMSPPLPSPSLEADEPRDRTPRISPGRTSSLRCTVNEFLPRFPNPMRRFRPAHCCADHIIDDIIGISDQWWASSWLAIFVLCVFFFHFFCNHSEADRCMRAHNGLGSNVEYDRVAQSQIQMIVLSNRGSEKTAHNTNYV